MPYHISTLVTVARMYYEEGLTQQEVADRLGLSRFTVLSMLKEAKEKGIVRIAIIDPSSGSEALEKELQEAFGLKMARVIKTPADNKAALKIDLGKATVYLLSSFIKDGVKLGIGWGTTIAGAVQAIEDIGLPVKNLEVYPLMGGLNLKEPYYQINDLCRRIAERTAGAAVPLYAPGVVEDKFVYEALLREPSIASVISNWDRIDIALLGIGTLMESIPPVLCSLFKSEDFEELLNLGAVGNFCCWIFYREDGTQCQLKIHERMLNISAEQLKKVPFSVGIAGGVNKALSIYGAVRGGYINCLVTDEETAKEVLALRNGKERKKGRSPGRRYVRTNKELKPRPGE